MPARYRALIDGYALRFSDAPLLLPGGGNYPSKRTSCIAFLGQTFVSIRHLPGVTRNGGNLSLWVKSGHRSTSNQCPLYPQKRTLLRVIAMSALCRFCCKRRLKAFWVSDSVAVMRFATGADHDGAAQSRPGATFLFIQPR